MKFGSTGSDSLQFDNPFGLAVDKKGYIFVADYSNHRITKFDSEGKVVLQFGKFGSGIGELHKPVSVTLDEMGNIYVSEYEGNRIQKFDSTGKSLQIIGKTGYSNGEFHNPHQITLDKNGAIYVADRSNGRIQIFSSNGQFKSSINGYQRPAGVAVDSAGKIFVADFYNSTVSMHQIDTLKKEVLFSSDSLNGPFNLAVDNSNQFYIVDNGNDRILRFTQDSEIILEVEGKKGSDLISVFPNPCENNLNVSLLPNRNNLSLQVFNVDGREVLKIEEIVEGNNYQIDLTNLISGTYLIRIKTNDIYFNKIIVKK